MTERAPRTIADMERDWRGASEYLAGHYAAEVMQAQRAEIKRLRDVIHCALGFHHATHIRAALSVAFTEKVETDG